MSSTRRVAVLARNAKMAWSEAEFGNVNLGNYSVHCGIPTMCLKIWVREITLTPLWFWVLSAALGTNNGGAILVDVQYTSSSKVAFSLLATAGFSSLWPHVVGPILGADLFYCLLASTCFIGFWPWLVLLFSAPTCFIVLWPWPNQIFRGFIQSFSFVWPSSVLTTSAPTKADWKGSNRYHLRCIWRQLFSLSVFLAVGLAALTCFNVFGLAAPTCFIDFWPHVLLFCQLASWPQPVLLTFGPSRNRFLGVSSDSSDSFIDDLF